MSDKNIPDADIGLGGIDKFNSETGKSEIIRPSEMGDKPFTIDDYINMMIPSESQNSGEIENLGFFIGLHTKKINSKLASYISSNLLMINEL